MKPLSLLFLLLSFSCWSQQEAVTIALDNNSSLELFREPFVAKQHQLEYKDKALVAIDGVPVFGADGDLPKYSLSKAILKIGDKTYTLQVDHMYNPWFSTGVNAKFFKLLHEGSNSHILKAQFSDGAGSYAAEWLIEGNASIRDIITKDEIIIESYFEQ